MNKKVFILALLSQFVLMSSLCASGKDNYKKGWDEFTKNNRTEARKYFQLAASESDTQSDALLSLSLVDLSELKSNDAFNNFQQFYKGSSNPHPYLYAMFSLPFMIPSRTVLDPAKLSFFEKIVEDPNMNGTLKAMTNERLGAHYEKSNNSKKSKELYARMGVLSNWQVLGSFDNTSTSGFYKDWGAVSKVSTDEVFKNKVSADVSWYTPPANKTNNWFHFEYYFILDNAIMYAQTFVNSPQAQEVYLRAGTSGSLKIWINDVLVSSVPEERNCDLDIYAYKVNLNEGTNRILVQIGQSEISSANFLIRLTDANGNPIAGLRDVASYSDYTKSTAQPSTNILPFFAEEYFEKRIKDDSDNLLNYIMLAETYLRNDKAHEATDILKLAEAKAPKFSFLHYRFAEAYARAQNQTDYSKEMENIKINDPQSVYALQQLFSDAIESEKYPEAESIIKKMKELYGESEYTDEKDLEMTSRQKQMEDMVRLAKIFYAKYPYSSDYMNLNYLIENQLFNNKKAATAIVENYNKKYMEPSAMEILSNIYLEQGNTEKGIKVLKQRIENMPYATGYQYSLANMLYSMQRYKEALSVSDDMVKLAPYLSDVYGLRGYIYRAMKDDANAKANFEKAIYYGPTAYDSREQLRLLQNKTEILELFPKYNLDSLIAKAPTAKDYPESNSVIVLNDNQMVFYPEGAKEYRFELAIKILNQSGIERWKEYNVSYYNNQKLLLDKYEVIKVNGQKIKAETNDRGLVVFTNLEIGDVLHLDYRVQDYSTGVLAKHFDDQFMFQYNIPSMLNRYCILSPEGKDFKYLVTNGTVEPVITKTEDNMKLYQWISKDVPAIVSEPYMSPYIDVLPTLTFSSMPDWTFVSNWYKDLTSNKFRSDFVLKETIADILKGKENLSELEKAELFYEYILNNITYSNVSFMQSNFVPQKASRTITTRLGDCKDVSTLFVALCKEAGIKANLVLISTRDNGKNLLPLPLVNFNHCIAQLDVDGKTYYLELTDNALPFGAALDADLHSNILPIPLGDEVKGDKLLTMDMPFRMKNITSRNTKVNINNKDILVSLTSTRFGATASYQRANYRNLGSEEQLKRLNQNVSSSYNVPVKVSNLSFINLDNLADSIICSYDIEIKNAVQDVAGMKIFKMPWTDNITSLEDVSKDSRTYPLEIWWYMLGDGEYEQIDVILPTGKKLAEVPQNVKLECANAVYEVVFDTSKDGVVSARRMMKRKTESVSPDQYEAFKNFMHAASESDDKQYAIK